jgi:hypothetical protein
LSNRSLVLKYLRDKYNFSDAGIAAIMANIQAESSFRPNALEMRDGDSKTITNQPIANRGFGILQWTPAEVQQRLIDFARSRGTKITDLETQVDFMVEELRPYDGLFRRLEKGREDGKDIAPEDLATELEKEYVRPSEGSTERRRSFARETAQSLGSRRVPSEEERITQEGSTLRTRGQGFGSTPNITGPRTPTEQDVLAGAGQQFGVEQAATDASRVPETLKNPRTGQPLTREQARKRLEKIRARTQGDPEALPPEEIDILAKEYGFAWSIISNNDEWFRIFTESVLEGATTDRFISRIRNTRTYMETTEAFLDSEVLRLTRPKDYESVVNYWKDWLQNKAVQQGVPVDDEFLTRNATLLVQGAIKPFQADKVVGEALTVSENPDLLGRAGQIQDTLRKISLNNGLNMSIREINDYVSQVLRNQITENDAYDAIRKTAANNYQKYSDRILSGTDLKDLASPYTRSMAEILEVNQDTIDLNDPLLTDALTGDMTLTDFRQRLRKDPRWQFTQNAQDETLGALSSVLRDFGLL